MSRSSHSHPQGLKGLLMALFHLPGLHDHHDQRADMIADAVDHDLAIRTVWLALWVLSLTTLLQLGIVWLSGSVALLADTAHNAVDALNSLPLLLAFYLARRMPTRRYSYGFGRAEDLAAIGILSSIVLSAGYIIWESLQRLFDPQPFTHMPWVALAALIGFVGNEFVALKQIRVGKRIGSAAMVADGQHARIDGLTSLAVLVAVAGSWLGWAIIDPIVGCLIAISIVGIALSTARIVWQRLMDAVEPALIHQLVHYAGEVPGVQQVQQARARWLGHRLFVDLRLVVAAELLFVETHAIRQQVEQLLRQALPQLGDVCVDIKPDTDQYEPAQESNTLLPPRYQTTTPSAAPMGAADLAYDQQGAVAWNEIWTDFCDLALAGGPPHRGTLLEPVDPTLVAADPAGYTQVLQELERGLALVTGLPIIAQAHPGWIGVQCDTEAMALWLLRAIVVENVAVRREGTILFVPAGPHFQLHKEIKNVVTVVAKTTHYWQEHLAGTP